MGFGRSWKTNLRTRIKNNKNNVEDPVREYDGLMKQDDEAHMRRKEKRTFIGDRMRSLKTLTE